MTSVGRGPGALLFTGGAVGDPVETAARPGSIWAEARRSDLDPREA